MMRFCQGWSSEHRGIVKEGKKGPNQARQRGLHCTNVIPKRRLCFVEMAQAV